MGPPANISRLEVIRYSDRDALTEAFEQGAIDVTIPNGVTPQDLARIAESRPDAAHTSPSSIFLFLHPNLDHPLLGRTEVRRALLQAIDRERLADAAYNNPDPIAHQPVPGELPEGAELTEYNPEAAREALKEAGAQGEVITLTHSSTTFRPFLDLLLEDLEAAGLEIELEEVGSTMALWRDGGHDGLLLDLLRGSRDGAQERWWNIPTEDGRYLESARHSAYTDEVHHWVQREFRTLYPERREQLRDSLFAAWTQNLPGIPLVFADERMLIDPALHGWQRPPATTFGQGLEKWYFVDIGDEN